MNVTICTVCSEWVKQKKNSSGIISTISNVPVPRPPTTDLPLFCFCNDFKKTHTKTLCMLTAWWVVLMGLCSQWKAQQDRLLFLLYLKCDVASAFMNISAFVGMLCLLRACWDRFFVSHGNFTKKNASALLPGAVGVWLHQWFLVFASDGFTGLQLTVVCPRLHVLQRSLQHPAVAVAAVCSEGFFIQ